MGIKHFFKKAFSDMKNDAKAQHEADKAKHNGKKQKL